MIYIPEYESSYCVEIIDKDTIRVFEDNQTDFYKDYFIHSDYMYKEGQVDFGYIKNCSTLPFTTDYKYRSDFPQICFTTICIIALTIFPCYMLFRVFRKRSR